MKRREVLKLVTLSTGAVLTAPLLGSLVSGCKADIKNDDLDYELQFFTKDEFDQVKDLVNTILPTTDSPSAVDVGVHQTVDTMVGEVYNNHEQELYRKNLTSLIKYINRNGNFQQLDSESKIALLSDLSYSDKENLKSEKKAFLDLKQQTIAYYLTNEKIAKKYLNYLPVPGKYEACISLEEVGNKAWAL